MPNMDDCILLLLKKHIQHQMIGVAETVFFVFPKPNKV